MKKMLLKNKKNDYSLNLSRTSSLNSPLYPTYFKKRECIRYVNNPRTNLCAGCKRTRESHYEIVEDPNFKWNYRDCTVLSATDAYGILNFPGSYSKSAKYIRVEIDTNPIDMLKYLYSSEGWNLQRPQLILSITGGAQRFNIPNQMKRAFKRGLVKVAGTTGAWIVTGGTNTGVMRLVGEAVSEEFHKNHSSKIVVLGIATWGKIAMRDQMIVKRQLLKGFVVNRNNLIDQDDEKELFYVKKCKNDAEENRMLFRRSTLDSNADVYLDPNHNHFILVDDGSVGSFGREIDLRAKLETELRKGEDYKNFKKRKESIPTEPEDEFKVPMILIVVQGGRNTLLTVEKTVKQLIPILIIAESKGCADLIANAYNAKASDDELKNFVIESNILDKFKFSDQYEDEIQKAILSLKIILEHKEYINVFKLEHEQNIEMIILRAFLNLNQNQYFENLKLALQWNRDDIAEAYIFTGEEEFKPEQLAFLMEMALIQNKPNFVKLLLDNGLDLKSFFTVKRLLFLYNSHKIHQLAKKSPLLQLYKRKYLPFKNVPVITFEGVCKFLEDLLFEDFKPNFLNNVGKDLDLDQIIVFLKNANKKDTSNVWCKQMNREKFLTEVPYPEKNLFVWAILMNRIDIAKIFWQLGEHQISTALFASKLFKSMSKHLKDFREELNKNADNFEEMACGVLKIFDNLSDDLINGIILLQKIPYYNLDCLRLAVEANCLEFISLPTVQNLLTEIWHGRIEIKNGFKASLNFGLSLFSLGLLAPFLLFRAKSLVPKPPNYDNTFQDLNISHNKRKKIANRINYSKKNVLKEYFMNGEIYMDTNEKSLWCFKKKIYNFKNALSHSDSECQENEEEYGNEKFFQEDDNQDFQIKVVQIPDENCRPSALEIYWRRYRYFIDSPRVHFIYETLFYAIFLSFFSYMLLCDFEYYDTKFNLSVNIAGNSSHYSKIKNHKNLAFSEYLIIFWVLMYLLEESRQFIFNEEDRNFRNKFSRYFNDRLNYIDFLGCIVFILGLGLRIISFYTNENIFKTARIVYALDLSIWYMRLLHVAIVFKSLGPKLVMIQKMIYDLLFFLLIIVIFVISFAVTTQATMFPGNKFDTELIFKMINKAYWPIYGEMKILEELTEDECIDCPDIFGKYYSFFALMIYMIAANVLLVNLLIAMFSSTYNDVQAKTDQIWKFQRYKLVFEYYDSSVFPPPLSVFAFLTSMIGKIKQRNEKNNEKEIEEELFLEKQFAEEYLRHKNSLEMESCKYRTKSNSEKLDILEKKLDEFINSIKKESCPKTEEN